MKATTQLRKARRASFYTLLGCLFASASFAPTMSFAQTATQGGDVPAARSSSLPAQSPILQPVETPSELNANPNAYYGAGYNPDGLGVQKTGPFLGATQQQQQLSPGIGQNTKRFDFTPYIQQSFTYSDNIDLAPDGQEEGGFVSSSTAGFDVQANTRRLRTNAGASVTYDHYFSDDSDQDNDFRPYAYINSSLEAVKNFFFIDAFGSVTTRTLSENQRFSANPSANRDDQAIVYSGTISPSIRQNIGGYVNTELRYAHSRIGYTDDDDDIGNRDGQFSNTFSAAASSDPRKFRRFGWNTRVEHEIYENEGEGGDQVRTSASAGIEIPLSPRTALFSNVGHDWFDPDLSFDGQDASGLFGNVGVRFAPNQRFSGEAYLGFRYGGFDYGATMAYMLTKRLQLIGSARRSVETGSLNGAPIDYDSAFIQTGDGQVVPVFRRDDFRSNPNPALNTGNFSDFYTTNFDEAFLVNRIDGSGGTLGDNTFGIVDSSTLRDTVQMSLRGSTAGGLRYTLAGTAQNRQFSFSREDELVLGASAGIEKDITNRLTLGSNLSYTHFDGDSLFDIDTDTAAFSLSANYLLTPMVSTFARYTYTQRFADQDASEYTENSGTVGVRASF